MTPLGSLSLLNFISLTTKPQGPEPHTPSTCTLLSGLALLCKAFMLDTLLTSKVIQRRSHPFRFITFAYTFQ